MLVEDIKFFTNGRLNQVKIVVAEGSMTRENEAIDENPSEASVAYPSDKEVDLVVYIESTAG